MGDAVQAVGKKIWGYRYVLLFILWLVYVINYFDRISVLTFLPLIRDELNLTPAQAGVGASVFFFAYAIAQVSAGWLADRIGAKKVMYIAVVVFTFFTFITGLIRNYTSFILVRLGLGIGEGHHFAPAQKCIAEWFPVEEKGRATGFFSTAWAFGPAVIPVIITALAAAFGSWRPVFYVLAVPGVVGILVIWWFVANKPEEFYQKGRISKYEYDFIKKGIVTDQKIEEKKGAGMAIVAKDRHFWMYCVVMFCTLAIYWGSTTWISSFLYDQHKFNLKTMGALVSLPYVVAMVAMLTGGWVTDHIFKGKCRPALLISFIGCIPVLFMIGMVPKGQQSMLLLMLVLMGFFVNLNWGAIFVWPQLRYPKEIVGSAIGLSNGFGQLGAFISPLVAGYLVVKTAAGNNYTNVFIFFSAMALLATIMTFFLKENTFKASVTAGTDKVDVTAS